MLVSSTLSSCCNVLVKRTLWKFFFLILKIFIFSPLNACREEVLPTLVREERVVIRTDRQDDGLADRLKQVRAMLTEIFAIGRLSHSLLILCYSWLRYTTLWEDSICKVLHIPCGFGVGYLCCGCLLQISVVIVISFIVRNLYKQWCCGLWGCVDCLLSMLRAYSRKIFRNCRVFMY